MPSELAGFTPADTGQRFFALCKSSQPEMHSTKSWRTVGTLVSRWINACSVIRKMQSTRDTHYLDKVPPKDFLSREMN
ncbi:hypothetical protein K0M31_000705 [Melipona bicolor]|uniref:Uncharacterized protein n=1 Tax=Melipona bicolor TaxID=60889 RepID=A0AA40GE26_9HYME|nr:hypothetical protein K0M31_000705 [Melipona bicolor]